MRPPRSAPSRRSACRDASRCHQADGGSSVTFSLASARLQVRWDAQREGRATAGIVGNRDGASQDGHDVFDDGEAKTGALAVAVTLPEPFEYSVTLIGGHAGAAVRNLDRRLMR